MNRVKFVGIIAIVAMISLTMTACEQPNDPAAQPQQWTVSLIRNHTATDNTTVDSFTHIDGAQFPTSVTIPAARSGWAFTGYWTARSEGTRYFDDSGARTTAANDSRTLQNNIRLYAQWLQETTPPNEDPEATPPNEDPETTPPNEDPGQEGQIPANLVGTWVGEGWSFVLNANGSFTWGPTYGTLSVDGNNLLMEFDSGDGSHTVPFSLDGNTLTLSTPIFASPEEHVFTRQITWTAVSNSTTFTTAIDFTFSSDPGALEAEDIRITSLTSVGTATRGNLTGSGLMRSLAVSYVRAGDVSVSIEPTELAGIVRGPQTVTLYVSDITWTATPLGDPTTTAIEFTFVIDPGVLQATSISISDGTGSAIRGALTGSGPTRTLAVSNVSAGTVSVSINRAGIASGPQPLTLAGPATTGITWTATPVGYPTTTRIDFTFSHDPGFLQSAEIAIYPAVAALRGWVSGEGLTRSLEISYVFAGTVSVSINRNGVAAGPRTVTLAAPEISWTATPTDSHGSPATDTIVFSFSRIPGQPMSLPVGLLSTEDISITAGTGSAEIVELVGGRLAITNVVGGTVSVSINREGFASEPRTIELWFDTINWTAEAFGNPTNSIIITFSRDPGTATVDNFRIVSAGVTQGSAVVSGVTQEGTRVELSLENVGGGSVDLYVIMAGVNSSSQRWMQLEGPSFVNWNATQTANYISFNFWSDPGEVNVDSITIVPVTGDATMGALSGSGRSQMLAISNIRTGDVLVYIDSPGIVRGPRTVSLDAVAQLTWEVRVLGFPYTTGIVIDFGGAIPPGLGLQISDVRIASGTTGSATVGGGLIELSAMTLQLRDMSTGEISISIDRAGIAPGPQTLSIVAPPPMPQLTGSVTITGTTQAGSTLTANTANLGGSGTIFFQWRAGNNNIAGATGSSLNLTDAHVNQMITVVVERAGHTDSVTSPAVGPVTAAPQLTGTVTIQGTPQVNVQLTAITTGLIGGSGATSFQWRVGNANVGTNSSTFTPAANHVNQMITVVVTRAGHTGSVTSPAVGPVQAAGGGVTVPSAPTGVTATAISASAIQISWNAVSGATNYRVEVRTTLTGAWSALATVTGTSHTHTGLPANTQRWYRVFAINSAGTSPASSIVNATTTQAAFGVQEAHAAFLQAGGSAYASVFPISNFTWNASNNTLSFTSNAPGTGAAGMRSFQATTGSPTASMLFFIEMEVVFNANRQITTVRHRYVISLASNIPGLNPSNPTTDNPHRTDWFTNPTVGDSIIVPGLVLTRNVGQTTTLPFITGMWRRTH